MPRLSFSSSGISTCVCVYGKVMNVSVPPRLSAKMQISKFSKNLATLKSLFRRKLSMPVLPLYSTSSIALETLHRSANFLAFASDRSIRQCNVFKPRCNKQLSIGDNVAPIMLCNCPSCSANDPSLTVTTPANTSL